MEACVAAGVEARAGSFSSWPAAMRWNFLVLGGDIAFFSLGLSISSAYTVLPLFVHHLTPENVAVALIPAIRALGVYGPQLLVAPLVERRSRMLPFILRATIPERVPYLVLALGALWLAPTHPGLLLVLFFAMIFVALGSGGLCYPAWLDMVARSVPGGWIGRFFGFWTGLGGILGIGGAAIAAALIARVSWPLNFALCFLLTFLAMVVSFVLLALGREPARTASRQSAIAQPVPRVSLRRQAADIWALLRGDSGLRRLIVSNALLGTATMAAGLFAVAALRQGGLSDAEVGVQSTVLFVASTAGYFLLGALGDRKGHKAVLMWGALCMGAAALLALFAHGFLAYAVVFLLLGLYLASYGTAGFTFITEFGPEARRPTYIALASVAYAPFAVGAPLLAGWLADLWGYGPVFLLSGVAGLAAALAFRYWVPNPRRNAGQGADF
jgi:MFS family permease